MRGARQGQRVETRRNRGRGSVRQKREEVRLGVVSIGPTQVGLELPHFTIHVVLPELVRHLVTKAELGDIIPTLPRADCFVVSDVRALGDFDRRSESRHLGVDPVQLIQ